MWNRWRAGIEIAPEFSFVHKSLLYPDFIRSFAWASLLYSVRLSPLMDGKKEGNGRLGFTERRRLYKNRQKSELLYDCMIVGDDFFCPRAPHCCSCPPFLLGWLGLLGVGSTYGIFLRGNSVWDVRVGFGFPCECVMPLRESVCLFLFLFLYQVFYSFILPFSFKL